MVLVMTGPGESKAVMPGVMEDAPGHFHVLELGQIERGLAQLK
jgi:hypothetical protein